MKSIGSRKTGLIVFWIGAVYLLAMGWAYSWRMVPTAQDVGPGAMASLVGFVWALSAAVGAVLVVIGAAIAARVERRFFWVLIVGALVFTAWRMMGTTQTLIPALFGIGGGLIAASFVGSAWSWTKIRPTLGGSARRGADLRMIGGFFYVVAAWDMCGLLSVGNFVLRPELAQEYGVTLASTINAGSTILVLFALGSVCTFLGQRATQKGVSAKA